MLTDQDVLLLKLALERELLDHATYRRVLDVVRQSKIGGGAGRALRQCGLAGERVGELAEAAAAAEKDPSGVILARSDLEDALVARAIERSKLIPQEKIDRARSEQKGMARTGELTSLSEVLVKRRWLEVPVAVEMRRRARERVATCPRCRHHYIVEPEKARDGRYKCRTCGIALVAGAGAHSAVDIARGRLADKPAPPIEASQMVAMTPSQLEQLRAAREQGMQKEAQRLATAKAQSSALDLDLRTPQQPTVVPGSSARPRADTKRVVLPSGTRPQLPGTPVSTSGTRIALPPAATPAARAPTPQPPASTPPADRAARAERETVGDDKAANAAAIDAATRARGEVPATPGSAGAMPGEDSSGPATARWESVHDIPDDKPASAVVATFGEYEILAEVARGGMGIVYKARRKGAQKLLALKVLISGVDATADQVERFEREGENARKLRHPGIVRVYDAGRFEGYHYIAMEFVEGTTLEGMLAKGAIEPRRAVRIVRDVAKAVHHIHQAGIIHRDLKPGNIILNDVDEPKLIDFGLAKSIDRRAKLTRSGAAVGTPYYMPPEQVRGENDKIGPASDVYALGAILFEMLFGEVPFRAENPIELYHKIASSELTIPKTVADLPDAVVTLIGKSMEKLPEDRYQTANDLAEDLDRFLKGEPLVGKRKTAMSRVAKRAHRYRWIVGLLVIVAGLLVTIVLLLLRPHGGAREAAQKLEEQGRAALLEKRYPAAKTLFQEALDVFPDDPGLEVDLARVLAAQQDPLAALSALERADRKGLADLETLEAFELQPIAREARFDAVRTHVKGRR
jgi:predicted Ser/Thr protein kinase